MVTVVQWCVSDWWMFGGGVIFGCGGGVFVFGRCFPCWFNRFSVKYSSAVLLVRVLVGAEQ